MSDLIMMDPSLLTPAQCVMCDMALQQLSEFDSDVPGPEVPLNEGQSAHDLRAPSAAEPSLHAMAARANAAKIELGLSPKYGAMLDKYIHASTAEQRLLAVAYTLKTAQQLEKAMKAERYTISDSLKKSLRTYAMLFIMSPHLSSFRGPVADAIISAMRELGFEGIPQPHEISNIDIIRAFLSSQLTQDRYTIKKKLDASIQPDSPTANIALLARNICGKFTIPMTVELLARVALLRWSLGQHPDAEAELFWLSVDHDIDEYHGSGGFKNPDTVAMWSSFRYLYNEDVKKYGDPTTTSVVLVSASAVTDNQHTVISKWAKTVEPPAEKKSNKRPRMDDGEDDAARASSGVGGAGDSGGADSSDRTGSSGGAGGDPNESLNSAVTE